MARKKTVRRKLARGKQWYKIYAPKIFNEREIGEILGGEDPNTIIGRTIVLPASEITGDITKHNIILKLRVSEAKIGEGRTEIIGYEISRAYLQRLVRRKVSKIDEVIELELKDGKKIKIKPLAITVNRANVTTRTALRKAIRELIPKKYANYTTEGLVSEILSKKTQKEIAKELSKIYPIKFLDIRKIEPAKVKNTMAK